MKSILVGAVMLLTGATHAFAADRSDAGSSKSWLGPYVGATINWDKLSTHDMSFGSPASDRSISGAIYWGYNFLQAHGIVVGTESDLKIGGAEVNDGSFLLPLEQRYSWSTKMRAGVAIGPLLPFASAGVSVGEFRADHSGVGSPGAVVNFRRIGFVWGGGLDWAIMPNFVLRAEYLRTDFGDRNINFFNGADPHFTEVKVEEVRVGGAYKF